MKTKIWIGVLLISLVGLGFTVQQRVKIEQTVIATIERNLKKGFPHIEEYNTTVLNEIRKQTYGYSQFLPLQEKALALDSMTTEQILSIDKNGSLDSLNYEPFFNDKEDYIEMQQNIGIFNLNAISNELKGSKLHPTLIKNGLLNIKVKLQDYLFGMTGVDNHGFFYQIYPMFPKRFVELGTVFKTELAYRSFGSDNGYKYKIFINGKSSTKRYGFYKTTPTQTGKHEYLIEVKDDNNKTVFEYTHHFFVENCKPLKTNSNE